MIRNNEALLNRIGNRKRSSRRSRSRTSRRNVSRPLKKALKARRIKTIVKNTTSPTFRATRRTTQRHSSNIDIERDENKDDFDMRSTLSTLFFLVCAGFAIYIVSPPGVQEYGDDLFNLIGMGEEYDGEWGNSVVDVDTLQELDPEYKSEDPFTAWDIVAPKNHNKMCLMFWKPFCRDWHFVQGTLTVLCILFIFYGYQASPQKNRYGNDRVFQQIQYERDTSLIGFLFGRSAPKMVLNKSVVLERRSISLVKFGIFLLSFVAAWASVNSLFALDVKSFVVAGLASLVAYKFSKLSIASSWEKNV